MSITRQITIWCDICNEWESFNTGKIRIAEAEAKKNGWTKKKGKEHRCPKCRE